MSASIDAFVAELARRDIRLWLDGEQLRINAPQGTLTPALVAQLRERKPELIGFLRTHRVEAPVDAIKPEPRPEQLPLSFPQQRLWFLAQLEESSAPYNIPGALRLRGRLDLEAFRASWARIESRHEALRTTFLEVQGQARQVIHPPRFELHQLDLSRQCEDAREAEVERLSRVEATQSFDLTTGPLWRVLLLALAEDEHVMFVTMHHIISDGWSLGVLTREFSTLYSQQVHGRTAHLPELPIQYADFALWQRRWLLGEESGRHLAYWREHLAGAPPLLTLPTDRPRPAEQSYRGARLERVVPRALASALEGLSQRQQATLFMTLQAAFAVLLMRYTGQEDICVGTPIANRQRDELEGLIGFFVNTLVLRNDLSGNPSFRALLERVRLVALAAYQHQDLPFESVVEALQVERTLAHSPVFQVMFALQNNPRTAPDFAGLDVSHVEAATPIAKFDLTLIMQDIDGALTASWSYKTDLFDHATIERMAGHFQALLEGIVADADRGVAQLPVLSSDERHRLLVEWNDTAVEYPPNVGVHALFEQQVERTPDAVAAVCEEEQATYGELNARANRLAHQLVAGGVGPGALVGLCARRSIEALVGLLGVLKAGAAYLPLDPDYPADRLAFMIEDARPALILTHRVPDEAAAVLEGCQTVELHARRTVGDGPDHDLRLALPPDSLAYVIYTSGSTGRPKGVEVTHRGLSNYLCWCIRAYPVAEGHGVPVIGSLSFDGTVPTLFAPLLVGQRVILLPEEDARGRDPLESLGELLDSTPEPLSLIKGTPTHLDVLEQLVNRRGRTARTCSVIAGGEAYSARSVRAWRALSPGCRIFNQYGPTEATVACCAHEVDGQDEAHGVIPIGRPVANTQVYLLDPYLQPVPVGVAGELYIGGVQLARGYLSRPDLTAERFVANPFGEGRLYRTGDRCRYRPAPDGRAPCIEFLGRMDDQVKLNGFRIEPGEIESALQDQPGVAEAAVIVRAGNQGAKLIAYLVLEEPGLASGEDGGRFVDELRSALGRRLPAYMIPAAFVEVEALPRTPSGKLDHRALPTSGDLPIQPDQRERVEPRTVVEETLTTIWREVLGNPRIGVTDNFFRVGGDSIMSIQIISRAREAGLRLRPKSIFQHQTIAELSRVAEPIGVTSAEQGPVSGELLLTPIQRRFFARKWQEPHHFNQAFVLELAPGVDPGCLEEAIGALLAHHDVLRSRFESDRGVWRQVIVPPTSEVPFEVVELDERDPGDRQEVFRRKADALQTSLDLATGPLLRAALFTGSPQRLLLVIHHLVVDGVSWRILLADLQRAYRQRSCGEPIRLPAKSTSFKRWATRLRREGPGVVADEVAYWNQVFHPELPPLPVDHRLGPNDNRSMAHVATHLSREQTAALLDEVPAAYRTRIDDLLLTALILAFADALGRTALLIELEGHGREDILSADDVEAIDLSCTVGWFTTVYPVRLELPRPAPGATHELGEAIKSIKEQLRGIPNRGIGHGILRHLDDSEAGGPRVPDVAADLRFNYLGRFDQMVDGALIQAISADDCGVMHSPSGLRGHLLDVNGLVLDGQLHFSWTYSRNLHRAETVRDFAERFVRSLVTLIDHCRAPESGGRTPSDFPDIRIRQAELDRLMEQIVAANEGSVSGKRARVGRIDSIYPLSPSQQGMLVETLAYPGSGVHVEQSVFAWHGPLNRRAFAEAWDRVLARHSILRTGFTWTGREEPVQFVLDGVTLPIEWRTPSGRSDAERLAELDRFIEADRARGFTLMQAPLMRLTLFRTDEMVHTVVWTRHHILTDGWSIPIIVRDLLAFYESACAGEVPALSPVRPYRDYIAWLGDRDRAATEAYWRSCLRGVAGPARLGAERAPGAQGDRFAHADACLPPSVVADLQTVTRRHGLTASTMVRAGWALLLNQRTGATDVIFGATVSGRPPEIVGVESIVGVFINTLPARIQLASGDDPSLLSWLERVQAQAVEQIPHAYCSSGQIHRWSGLPAAAPLYESLLVFESRPPASSAGGGRSAGSFEIRDSRSIGARTHHPLTLLIDPGDGFSIRAVYDTACFESASVEGILGDFTVLLRDLVEAVRATPQQPLSHRVRQGGPAVSPGAPRQEGLRPATPFVPARTATEQRLVRIWQEVLGVHSVSARDDFFDLGGHSIVALHLMARIQQEFGVNLPLATLLRHPTIEQLSERLTDTAGATREDWSVLVPIQGKGDDLPFFCVPGSGGNVLYLYELSRFLGDGRRFFGLQAVGLDGETPPYSTVEAIAAHHIRAMREVQPRGPYLIGGHSFGGTVAYEMAQQLVRAGHEVARLLLFDTAAPMARPVSRIAEWDDARWAVLLAGSFGFMYGEETRLRYEDLCLLSPDEQLMQLKVELERLRFLPPGADPRQARGWMQVYKSNSLTSYLPEAGKAVPMTLFRAEDDYDDKLSSEFAELDQRHDPSMGWDRFTGQRIEVIPVPGNHVTMMARPHVETLAARLRARLK